jgi:hypothetical protein
VIGKIFGDFSAAAGRPSRRSAFIRTALTTLAAASLPLTLVAAPSATAGTTTASPRPAAAAAEVSPAAAKLFVLYRTRRTCTVYPNHKMKGTAWKIPAGRLLIWRYNRDKTWSIISDPHRAKKQFPWWGVTRRSCIGKSIEQTGYPAGRSVPSRVLQARSGVTQSGWRRVIWSVPSSRITRRNVTVRSNATIRDPGNLWIGNTFKDRKVHVTSGRRGSWVKVYVPALGRYGWILPGKLR